jgi:dsDNA-binding SOS-regulon protein
MQQPVDQLPDEEVLQLSQMELTADQQAELSDLLARNSEAALSSLEQRRLDELMQLYRDGLRRKAEALKVAVQRNLIPPLDPK